MTDSKPPKRDNSGDDDSFDAGSARADAAAEETPEGTAPTIGTYSVLSLVQNALGSVSLDTPPPPADAPPSPGQPDRKYSVASEIGRGGMGQVLKAYDTDLHRWVAMKVIRRGSGSDSDRLSRFVEEAQVCGQLEHPNIPPVHEMGIDEQGRVFFTMKLVKGRTLREVAQHLSIGRPEVRREFTPIRVAQIVQQAAMGVHYANVRGVIHRDLKPENIMVGDYGEVLVMDWGLAKIVTADSDSRELYGEDPVETARSQSGLMTIDGVVQGTPAYLSPEQARGDAASIDERTDVFGLGSVLYECLSFRPPHAGRNVQEILTSARGGKIGAPSEVAPPGTRIPADLESICMKALSFDPESRHSSAREFQEDLQSFIEGTRDHERRRQGALKLVREGRRYVSRFNRLEEQQAEMQAEARRQAQQVAPFDSVEKKRALWDTEDRIEALKSDGANALSRAIATLNAAVQTNPKSKEARAALTDLYWKRFLKAESERRSEEATFYHDLILAYDDGRYADRLKGDGRLILEVDPPDANATLYRYERDGRQLVTGEPLFSKRTPLNAELPMGSYLVVLQKDGYRDVDYPVFIDRSEEHHGSVRLRTASEIGDGFVYIPGGEFFSGGDADAPGSTPKERLFLGDFFISRFPVTMHEYCAFLDALTAHGEDVKAHTPRQGDEVFVEFSKGAHRPVDTLVAGDIRRLYPPGFEINCPVFGVTWESARAYAQWRSELDSRPYELPPEDAWEKAARGVDGRYHPWGDDFDWVFVKGGLSRQESAQPEPVGSFVGDTSPYGVRDLAGSVREWTQTWFDERVGTRVIRGGSWSIVTSGHFRAASRLGYLAERSASVIGFRLYSREPANV